MSKMPETTDTTPARRFAETRRVPETGVWVRLAQPDENANSRLPADEHVLLTSPGRVGVVGRYANGDALARYLADRDDGGSEAPPDALVRIPAQAFARLAPDGAREA